MNPLRSPRAPARLKFFSATVAPLSIPGWPHAETIGASAINSCPATLPARLGV